MQLYFDECCSRGLSRELKALFVVDDPELIIVHVLDFYDSGTGDSTWLDSLKSNKEWIVITQDHGRKGKEKLPKICKELGITHVAFSPSIIRGGYSIQKEALMAVWSQLRELHRLPPGTKVKLTPGTTKGGVIRYELRVDGKMLTNSLPPLNQPSP